ncbi:MAG: transferase [Holophagaceae bacterium]|uniref:Transferase n=1 Tax=Candidatus Geothrix skivensis TaxID=2954439 RepID=A0A9D7SEX6_9BACT|nr:transferase [Candidatus Geothrix skivensis]
MTASSIQFPNVHLGPGAVVDDFVILGRAPKGAQPGSLRLDIGPDGVIRSHSVIYAGSTIGARFQCGHGALVREQCTIGEDCSIGSGSVLEFLVKLGNRVRIHSNCFVPEHSVLDDDCWIGPNVVFTNAKFPQTPRTKELLAGVHICRGAKVGANSTLLPGITIGAGALVGAGSVVTKDVPEGSVVAGNPARILCRVSDLRHSDTNELVYPGV